MIPVKITAVTIRDKQWDNGDRLLACFDCEVLGFGLNDCVLIRTRRGPLLAQAPRGDSSRKGVRAITIIEPSIRDSMATAAHAAFLALGGKEAA